MSIDSPEGILGYVKHPSWPTAEPAAPSDQLGVKQCNPAPPPAGTLQEPEPTPYRGRVTTRDVDLAGDTIRLAQFLKLAGVSDTGGEAKIRIANGEVRVNGEVELRRGRQLRQGDIVEIADELLRIH